MRCRFRAYDSAVLFLVSLSVTAYPQAISNYNVATANYDGQRTNSNSSESVLTPQNVASATFGRLGTIGVDGQIYAQPLYVSTVSIPGIGVRNVVYVVTMHNSVYAFDADSLSATPFWQVNLGTSVPSSVIYTKFVDIRPEVGILSTPVIDTGRGVLYVVAETYESGACVFRLHALGLANGTEMLQGPVVVGASVSGIGDASVNGTITFDPLQHIQRPGLLLSGGKVFIAFGSHADSPPYHGWIVAYDAFNLQNQVAVWNTTSNGGSGAVWQSGRAPAVDSSGNIYVSTGNGDYDGVANFGESFIKLSSKLSVLDWFTPDDWQTLSNGDYDLGSTGAALVPGTDLVVGGDKYGSIYSLHTGALGHLTSASGPGLQSFPAVRFGGIFNIALLPDADGSIRLYVLEQGNGLREFQLTAGEFNTTPVAVANSQYDIPYDGIAVSSNGGKLDSAIVWLTTGNHNVSPAPGTLHAFNAQTLTELWNSDMVYGRDTLGLFAKFVAPTVANGRVFVSTFSNQLAIYGLLASVPPSSAPVIAAVTNGATFRGHSVAPGEVVAIFGSAIGTSLLTSGQVAQTGTLTDQLAGYRVLFNGTPAPLLYLSSSQVGAVVPWSASGTSATVQVTDGQQSSPPVSVNLAPSAPGIFTADSSGVGQAAALNQDSSINSPSNPAPAGSVIVLYATGGGLMSPASLDGQITPLSPLPQLQLPVTVLINNQPATVLYAGAAPGLIAGVLQINAMIPAGTPSGNSIPVAIQIGKPVSPPGVSIAVQ
ncbi:MAG TPA: hypothetical protein VKG25_20740 [Bryobacteraceae bacterium]|nr:hypothetical protein [Bryobacteraceae bacterium]